MSSLQNQELNHSQNNSNNSSNNGQNSPAPAADIDNQKNNNNSQDKQDFVSPADFRMNEFIDKDKQENKKEENLNNNSGEGHSAVSPEQQNKPLHKQGEPPNIKEEKEKVAVSSDSTNKGVVPSTPAIPPSDEPSPEDFKAFIQALKEDVPKAWNKFHKKFDLPAFELVQQVLKGTEFDDNSLKQRIKLYQKELAKNIEQEFNLDPGTFRYDADEAIDPDSPSGVFVSRLRQFEEQLRNDVKNKIEIARQQQEKYKLLQEEDKKWFKETFYKDQPEKVDEILKQLSVIPQKILAGELPPHKHPFSLRTMLLGVFFDDLVEKIKAETEEKIKAAYESQGMFLSGKSVPDDLKKISKGIPDEGGRNTKKTHSPLDNLIIDFLNK